jgi:hypothetical protein
MITHKPVFLLEGVALHIQSTTVVIKTTITTLASRKTGWTDV